jgi:hypothetical protein
MPACNVSFFSGSFDTDSRTLCDYANYHVFMFVVCGTAAVSFLFMALFLVMRYGRNPAPDEAEQCERCAWWGLVFLGHMGGFEGALALFYVCVVAVMFYSLLSFFVREVWRASALVLRMHRIVLLRSNAVDSSSSPSSSSVEIKDESAASSPQIVIVHDCTICLESGGAGPWVTTQCGHVFHVECITKWRAGTCPLCRGRVWK